MGKDHKGNCFLAAVSNGVIKLDVSKGKKEMNRVIHEEECHECGKMLKVTIRMALNQNDWGRDYGYGGSAGGAVKCRGCGCVYYRNVELLRILN